MRCDQGAPSPLNLSIDPCFSHTELALLWRMQDIARRARGTISLSLSMRHTHNCAHRELFCGAGGWSALRARATSSASLSAWIHFLFSLCTDLAPLWRRRVECAADKGHVFDELLLNMAIEGGTGDGITGGWACLLLLLFLTASHSDNERCGCVAPCLSSR